MNSSNKVFIVSSLHCVDVCLHCVDVSVLCMQLPGVTGSYLSAGLCPHWTGRVEDTSKDYWNCWDVLQPARLPVRVCVCQYSYYRVVYVLCLVRNGTQWSCWGGVISNLFTACKSCSKSNQCFIALSTTFRVMWSKTDNFTMCGDTCSPCCQCWGLWHVQVQCVSVNRYRGSSCYPLTAVGRVPQWQPHCRSGLANLPSVGAVP